jgi:tryptophan synthase beta subunit
VVNLSGRGDKDLDSVASYLSAKTRAASPRRGSQA